MGFLDGLLDSLGVNDIIDAYNAEGEDGFIGLNYRRHGLENAQFNNG